MPPVHDQDAKKHALNANLARTPEALKDSALMSRLSQLSYAEGKSALQPGGLLDSQNNPAANIDASLLRLRPLGNAANNDAEVSNPEEDARLQQSILVAGIQPDMMMGGNFLARQWYHGSLGGPKTKNQGQLILPYDDVGSVEGDIARVKLYGNYASGNTSWDKVREQDEKGAQHVSGLVDQFMGISAQGGIIYAHSGGGAATMATLRRMTELKNAESFASQNIRVIQVQGLEAVITEEQVAALGELYAEMGVRLVVDNNIAGPKDGGAAGSETWNELITPNIKQGGENPYITHTYDGLESGDGHANMVPALYKNGKMPSRSKY